MKKQFGLTLLEVVIAVAVLAVATVPIYGLFVSSTRINVASHRLTAATFTAQLFIEECVGLNRIELEEKFNVQNGSTGFDWESDAITKEYNGFTIKAYYQNHHDYKDLVTVYVSVLDTDLTTVMITQQNIINVAPGGMSI
ncbi:MAG: prepilin-type N-terminal cleavage/methylation domain-containing protein [Defluviitaleaceae bacterium]|nr:prepilin-type N-terminal cleavage/methylation domain-containing protein [Defluviitaleaceae bacterium]